MTTRWTTWKVGRVTHSAPYTPLRQCRTCGCRGSPVTVKQQRPGLTCMRCWNVLRPTWRAQQELDEIGRLARQLEKARGNESRRAA